MKNYGIRTVCYVSPLATTYSSTRFNFSHKLDAYNLAHFVHDDSESYYRNTNSLVTPTDHVLPKTVNAARDEKLWDTDRMLCQLHWLRRTLAHFSIFHRLDRCTLDRLVRDDPSS